ncbi:uncharacterized protein SOCEGT47_047850 [Sorangium cellulosum]|uniref:Lipoprotein n=1 Tax=Sorangium cellulosum TaxID=56 RepID=A0A4P2Q5D1_SORCE|nr:hypothetical protein [Sorangium cellulosum]AUX24248.1 uncharacterized protein SOCEGT47_047850 [Sorangium cellulosum]
MKKVREIGLVAGMALALAGCAAQPGAGVATAGGGAHAGCAREGCAGKERASCACCSGHGRGQSGPPRHGNGGDGRGMHAGHGGMAGMGRHGGGAHLGMHGAGPHRGGDGTGAPGGHGPMGGDSAGSSDRELFHYLLDHRGQVRRQVTMLPDGVETLTESDDPAVAQGIRDHVQAMRRRMEERRPIHARDPLFAAIFAHADRIAMTTTPTEKGVRVKETSTSPEVVRLIQAHATVIDAFLANGHAEVRRDHAAPAAKP